MLAKPVRRDEQIKLIMECRQSGLSDYDWCKEHNINVGTFYNWVKRLKHVEGITFPRGNKADGTFAYKQEVVKLDMLQGNSPIPSINDQYNNSITDHSLNSIQPMQVMKINLAGTSIEVPNGTDPRLLETTIRILGGLYAR